MDRIQTRIDSFGRCPFLADRVRGFGAGLEAGDTVSVVGDYGSVVPGRIVEVGDTIHTGGSGMSDHVLVTIEVA